MYPFDELGEVAVIDCETTGLDPEQDRIISLGVVLADLRRDERHEAQTLEVMVNPGMSIPADATQVHGITDENVADLGGFGEIAERLKGFIGDRPLVGFNVSLDKRFLNAELKRRGLTSFHQKPSYCVMRALEQAWEYRPSLRNARVRMSMGPAKGVVHHPLDDAITTMNIAGILHRVDFDTVQNAPGDRWSGVPDKPATKRQLDYIRDLGGNPRRVKTRKEASETIDLLKVIEKVRLEKTGIDRPGCLGVAVLASLLSLVGTATVKR